MPEQFVAQRRDRQVPDRCEELGLLYWKIGVLVIGMRLVIAAPGQPALVGVLAQAARLLLGGALALVALDLLRLLRRVIRRARQGRGAWPHVALGAVWRRWLAEDWLFQLAVDGLLAATILQVAFALSAWGRLDWGGVAWLIAIGAIRVAFRELRIRAHHA